MEHIVDGFVAIFDSLTSSANGAFGRHERHDSAGMRLVTAASWWRSSVRRSRACVVRQAGQRTHKNQYRAVIAAPIVGEEQHRHAFCLALVPGTYQPLGILEHLSVGRAPSGRCLL